MKPLARATRCNAQFLFGDAVTKGGRIDLLFAPILMQRPVCARRRQIGRRDFAQGFHFHQAPMEYQRNIRARKKADYTSRGKSQLNIQLRPRQSRVRTKVSKPR